MKTLQDLYEEIKGDDKQKRAFVEAMKAGAVRDFLEERGCDATEEEVREFLEAKAAEDSPIELSMDELAEVAGGSADVVREKHYHASETCIRDCC